MGSKKVSDELHNKRKLASERHKARHFAMQGLYQWQLNATTASDIEAQFRVDFNMKGTDFEYFRELLAGVQREVEELDELLVPIADARELATKFRSIRGKLNNTPTKKELLGALTLLINEKES